MGAPARPVLRWHGGKWNLAPWIISHFPVHKVYTETFGGGASVLIRKPRSYCEIYNDLDDWVMTLFAVLRDAEQSKRLLAALRLTPFARAEFERARLIGEAHDPIDLSRRLLVRSYMGFGSDAHQLLLADLQSLVGMVVLSGYRSPLYEQTLKAWRRIETRAYADGARARVEVLWLNPACAAALDAAHPQLFERAT